MPRLKVANRFATSDNWRSRAVDETGNELWLLPGTIVEAVGQAGTVPGAGGSIPREKIRLEPGTRVASEPDGIPFALIDFYEVWAVQEDLAPASSLLLWSAALVVTFLLWKGYV